jgi:hypothetical protein
MEKKDRMVFSNHELYTFEEVMKKGNLSRSELFNLKHGSSLQYTLVYDMFKFIGDERSHEDILNECKTSEKWFENHFWTMKQHDDWVETHGIPMLRRIFRWSKTVASREISWFLLMDGFTISDYEDHYKKWKEEDKK